MFYNVNITIKLDRCCPCKSYSPLTTSATLQVGSILPMCFGWAGLVSLPNRSAIGKQISQTAGCKGRTTYKFGICVGFFFFFWWLTVLVDEHAKWDAVGVEAVEEILNVAADGGVKAVLLPVLHHTLRHSGNNVVVPVADLDQELQETGGQFNNSVQPSCNQSAPYEQQILSVTR